MKALSIVWFVLAMALSHLAFSQPMEYGDAPEGVMAYPSNGIIGAFPTCKTVGPGGWVQHTNFGAWLGPSFDLEIDGNAGLCPGFAPYDMDECYADGDAGLMFPQPYTIANNQVVTCPSSTGTPLGMVCQTAVWGQMIDIMVHNTMPGGTVGFMNVLFDWDQNGLWGGSAPCPGGPAAEHVLINWPIPNGYVGPLSALAPPPFLIGPFGGYCWARFTITEMPVGVPWDGSGSFEDGESEDYLISVSLLDFGDAPEGSLAYPVSGMIGNFPTCTGVGSPNSYISHQSISMYFGPSVDNEPDGNGGLCSPFTPPYDFDECMNDPDAGLLIPFSYTITGNPGSEVVSPCVPGTGNPLDTLCGTVTWGTELDILVNNFFIDTAYFNLLIDWNYSGTWALNTSTLCAIVVPEHIVVDFVVPPGFTGPLSLLSPPSFTAGPWAGFAWSRFSLTEVPVGQNWDGSGIFNEGETEDYLLEIIEEPEILTDMGDAPESALAYPASGVTGSFPTCLLAGAAGSEVMHFTLSMFLGFAFDVEADGNSGLCNPYNQPYNNDECFGDVDAGLLNPGAYTISGPAGSETVVTCPQSGGGSIDSVCHYVSWGPQIDIQVNNFSNQVGYFNAIFDWNMDGFWADDTNTKCNNVTVPEHVLVDLPVPAGFIGPVSALAPPVFMVGPDSGYVWSRMTLSDMPVGAGWDGSGLFYDGESEDYLMHIAWEEGPVEEIEYGDAPEGILAYPASGITGNFPTCLFIGPLPSYIQHSTVNLYFGPASDYETDGNAGLCNPFNQPYDSDECMSDGDAGLLFPMSNTITGPSGGETVTPCLPPGGISLDTVCYTVNWGMNLDIHVVNNGNAGYFNLLCDWNQDGRWMDQPGTQCISVMVPEHAVIDFPIPGAFSGPLSALAPPSFVAGPNAGYVWCRFSLTTLPVGQGWDGSGIFEDGETEDYLLELDLATGTDGPDATNGQKFLKIFPNPAKDKATVSYLAFPGISEFRIRNVQGLEICRIYDQTPANRLESRSLDLGPCLPVSLGCGIYIVEQWLGGVPVSRAKLILVK